MNQFTGAHVDRRIHGIGYLRVDCSKFSSRCTLTALCGEPIWGLCFWLLLYETSLWCCSSGNNGDRREEAAGTSLLRKFSWEGFSFEGCIGFKGKKEKKWWTGLVRRKWGQRGRSAHKRKEGKEWEEAGRAGDETEDSGGTGQRRQEGAVIISGLKTITFPLITIIVLILCCDCLKWFCPLSIKPTFTI